MLQQIDLQKILFLDIETVPEYPDFKNLSPEVQALWDEKTAYQRGAEITPETFYERAGIWAEFGKIVCISVGYFTKQKDVRQFRVKSFSGEEAELLTAFRELITIHFNGKRHRLCAHNGKEFDFPFLARRMIVHQISLPNALNIFGKKPWEIPHLDTMQLWRFGDYKHYTSLKLMTQVLDIPSPKEDIDGSQVREVYYQDQDSDRIVRYCERDVVAVAQVILRFRNEPLLSEEEIVFA